MPRAPFTQSIVILALAAGLSLCAPAAVTAAATPTLAQEEHQGEGIVESVRAGEKQCADLSADEFELIGEYAMGKYLGSEVAHAAMNQRMTAMMGAAGERRMHTALGYRYSGCSGGPASGWVGSMAGMMGFGGGDGRGMMGGDGYEDRGSYSGTMMGSSRHGGGGMSAMGVALIAIAAAAIGAGVVVLLGQRQQPRRDPAP